VLTKPTYVTILATLLLAVIVGEPVAASPVHNDAATGAAPLATTVAATISYQGQLTDATGAPLSGSHDLVFQLWDDAAAGSQVGADIVRNNIPVTNGLFTVNLGVPHGSFDGQALWLRLRVDGEWLAPRQDVRPVPYALSLRPGAQIKGNGDDPFKTLTVTNEGLGTALKVQGGAVGLDVAGMTGIKAQGDVAVVGQGIVGLRGTGTTGVEGRGTTGSGVSGDSESGTGVAGHSASGPGVTGTADGNAGKGVVGTAPALGGVGVEGQAGFGYGVAGSGEIGVHGTGSTGAGVWGEGVTGVLGASKMNQGRGVRGSAPGTGAVGVEGQASLGTGVAGSGDTGVRGTSTVGFGVSGDGATGVKAHGTNYGVDAEGSTGIIGKSTLDLGGVGIRGQGSGTGVRGEGSVGVSGDGATGVQGSGGQAGVVGRATTGTAYGVEAHGIGSGLSGVAVYAENLNQTFGMAAYMVNSSSYHTVHLKNTYPGGGGGVLYLQNMGDVNGGGGGDFITAVGKDDVQFRVDSDGEAWSDVGFHTPAADFAEQVPAAAGVEPGDVLAIGPDGTLVRATAAYQTDVAGVYSTAPGFVGGAPAGGAPPGTVPLAVVGIVPVKASAENGPIRPGDLLVSSATPGYAMRAGAHPPQGTVIGKAMARLDRGTGLIRILATLQ
jgi:hypothetical protein